MQKTAARNVNYQKCGSIMMLLAVLNALAVIAAVLASDSVQGKTPAMAKAGAIGSAAVLAVYAAVLLALSSEEPGYRTASVFFLLAAAAGAAGLVFRAGTYGAAEISGAAGSIFLIPARIKECSAHSFIVSDPDFAVSSVWRKIRKWHVVALAVAAAASLLAPLDTFFSSMVVSAGAILCAVMHIVQTGLLLRSSRLCRDFYGTLGR